MKNIFIKKRWGLAIALLIAAVIANAQTLLPNVLSSGGAYYTSANNSLSVTIGEMTMVETFHSSSTILTQGFQQPLELSVGIRDIAEIDWGIQAYPNPTPGYVTVSTSTGNGLDNIQLYLFDAAGRLVADYGTVGTGGATTLDMSKLAAGVYVLHLNAPTDSRNIRLVKN